MLQLVRLDTVAVLRLSLSPVLLTVVFVFRLFRDSSVKGGQSKKLTYYI